MTFLRPGYVPRQILLVASTRKEKMSARLKKSRGFDCEWSGWVWFQSRAVISLIVPASFSLFHAHMFDHFCEEPCLSQFILEAIFFAWRKLLDARKEDTKRCFIYKHWSRVVWRTWLELLLYLNFSRLQPPLSYKVAAPCQWRPFQRICYIMLYSCSQLIATWHDWPGGCAGKEVWGDP